MIGEIFVRHLALIGELSEADKAALMTLQGEIRDIRRGEDLLTVGDRPRESVCVISGMLHRYKTTPEGKRQIHSFYLPGDTPCLETVPIDVMDNSLAATAPSRVGIVPHPELFRVMSERPQVLHLLWRETLVQAAVFREWLTRNSQLLAHGQMAHFFCEIMVRARAHGIARGDSCELPITQEDLGDALGMSTVHVNRTLMVLRAGGLVEFQGGVLTVPDLERLMDMAEFDPTYLHLRPV